MGKNKSKNGKIHHDENIEEDGADEIYTESEDEIDQDSDTEIGDEDQETQIPASEVKDEEDEKIIREKKDAIVEEVRELYHNRKSSLFDAFDLMEELEELEGVAE